MKKKSKEDPNEELNEDLVEETGGRNLWIRGLFMGVVMVVLHVCGTVLFVVTAIQFVVMLLGDTPNPRLVSFGRSLGGYLQQSANFLVFATDDMPFPFSDWPSGD